MPIPRCVPANKYTCMLFTGGPFTDEVFTTRQAECKQAIYNVIYKGYGVKLAGCVVAMEQSHGGYRHFHAAVLLTKRERFTTVAVALKKYVESLGCETEVQKPNCGVYHWPHGTQDPWTAAKAYLTAPVKDKSIDADFLEVEPTDWTAVWRKLDYSLFSAYIQCSWCWGGDPTSPFYDMEHEEVCANWKATKKLNPNDRGKYICFQ